ncbi:MAG: putative glycolipid-binding domain-containing protein [Verrucomicrobiota bacterium JB022]|nr:putative glycolipid-binding domain-containing protein [Verrucomicrobiota bacterium JB022]
MNHPTEVLFWQRVDTPGLERLTLHTSAEGVCVESTILCAQEGGFRLDHRWQLDTEWRSQCLEVQKWTTTRHTQLKIERQGYDWHIDGTLRTELEGAEDLDLSATPFSNTLPIRRMMAEQRSSLTFDACYVDVESMSVGRSRQRYERLGPARFRYIDLGLFAGFMAELEVDPEGLIERYQHLFERVKKGPPAPRGYDRYGSKASLSADFI